MSYMFRNSLQILFQFKSLLKIPIAVLSFFPSYCVFQEQGTRRTIRCASERGGLYYLEDKSGRTKVENSLSTSLLFESVMSNKNKLWLYHHCLGHLSFKVLKLMFPSLFNGSTFESFHCHDCEPAKSINVLLFQ